MHQHFSIIIILDRFRTHFQLELDDRKVLHENKAAKRETRNAYETVACLVRVSI